jgi:delta 1-pyrroline-5-carboxylate dehydrogenase
VANPHRITEFILYAGYVLYEHKSYDAIYNIQDKLEYQVYNVADWQANHFNEILAQCQENSTALTFSVHRRAYQLLSEEQKIRCLEFLYNRKLINSVENTKIRLNTI